MPLYLHIFRFRRPHGPAGFFPGLFWSSSYLPIHWIEIISARLIGRSGAMGCSRGAFHTTGWIAGEAKSRARVRPIEETETRGKRIQSGKYKSRAPRRAKSGRCDYCVQAGFWSQTKIPRRSKENSQPEERRDFIMARARCKRVFTAPTLQPRRFAISGEDRPCWS